MTGHEYNYHETFTPDAFGIRPDGACRLRYAFGGRPYRLRFPAENTASGRGA